MRPKTNSVHKNETMQLVGSVSILQVVLPIDFCCFRGQCRMLKKRFLKRDVWVCDDAPAVLAIFRVASAVQLKSGSFFGSSNESALIWLKRAGRALPNACQFNFLCSRRHLICITRRFRCYPTHLQQQTVAEFNRRLIRLSWMARKLPWSLFSCWAIVCAFFLNQFNKFA